MALTYDQINAITRKKYIPKLYDNIFDSNPLLKEMKEKAYRKVDGGERVVIPLNYAQNSAGGWYQGAETLNTTDNDVMTAAEYTWKQCYENISITRLDELKNSGDSQVLSFVESKIKIAEKSLLDQLATGIYSAGTDAKSIVGVRNIVGTANSIGGISQTDYSWWRGQVDSSTTTLSIMALQNVMTNATVNNDSPTIVAGTRANYDRYYGLLQPQQRFVDEKMAKGGFSSLQFNGVPFVADSYCPSGHIFLLNLDYLELVVHEKEDMRFEDFIKPVNQNVKVAKIYWMGVLASSNNRLHGKLSAIAA